MKETISHKYSLSVWGLTLFGQICEQRIHWNEIPITWTPKYFGILYPCLIRIVLGDDGYAVD